MEKKSYIGPNEVVGVTILDDRKTPGGNEMVSVMYSESPLPLGTVTVMPKQAFELVVTEQPIGWDELRDKQSQKIQAELAKVVLEWDVQYDDINAIVLGLTEKLYTAFDRATNYLWTKDDNVFVPGKQSAIGFRTLLEAEAVLNSISNEPKKSDTKEEGDDSGESGEASS